MDSDLVCHLADQSRLKIIGLGGIGGILSTYLAVFLKSLDREVRLVLIDGDHYEARNAKRMLFHRNGNKAEVKAAEIAATLGPCGVSIAAVPAYVTDENIGRLVDDGDLIFLCVDNHKTRKLVSDRCDQLQNVVLFSGGNEGVDPPRERGTYGNVQIAVRHDGADVTVPITRYHPEIQHAEGRLPSQLGCEEMASSIPQILFTNLAVASAMLNAFFTFTCGRLTYQEVKLDILAARMLPQLPIDRCGSTVD